MSEHELWNELGNLYFLSGAYPQAVHAYNRSIQLDERFGRPYSNLALTYVQQGKFDQAVDLYRRSIELLTEDKERAISWNRLGNVYRYLKDYQAAVLAYRRADELDPDSAEGHDEPGWICEPAREPEADRGQPMQTPLDERVRTEPVAAEAPAREQAEPVESPLEPERIEEPTATDATVGLEPVPAALESSTATWAPEDPTPYQQDMSESLDPGTLTTWGNPGSETDYPEADWQIDPDTEVYVPDLDSDDLSKWLPIPEEAPESALEFYLDGFDPDLATDEPEQAIEEVESVARIPVKHEEPVTPEPVPLEAPTPVEITALLPATTSTHAAHDAAAQSNEPALDIIVQERPAEFVVAAGPEEATIIDQAAELDEAPAMVAPAAEPDEAPADVAPAAEAEAGPSLVIQAAEPAPAPATIPEASEPVRDEDEMREIEAGLAKFKRVVQLNPRNARAWDTLGNLYKTAGLYKEALLAYQQAIANDPSKALYLHHLGLVYACEGRVEEAIDAYQRVIAIDPNHSLAHATLGGYYRKMGLEELAQKHVGIAMKSIFDSENEYNRACLAAICGDTEQALDLLRVALKNKQTYVDWILRDPDLDFIRQDPRFKQLISDYAR